MQKGQLWLQLHFAWDNAVTIVIRPVHRGEFCWHGRQMHSPKSSIPASISFWQTLPFFKPQFQHQLYTSGWQNLSFHPAHSNCCSIFLRIGAKLGFVFNVALAMRNFTMTADTFLTEAQATPYLQKNVGRKTAAILGCKSHVLSPPKKIYFKICCPQAFGWGFVVVVFF